MQTKHFKLLTLKNNEVNIYLILCYKNNEKTSLSRMVKNEITFLFLHSYLFTPFTKGIYNLKKFNNLMIKNNL